MSPPSCFKCGSRYVQRARMRTWWQRLLKKHTRFRRYACGDCYHRGWTRAVFDVPEGERVQAVVGPPPAPGRRSGASTLPAVIVMTLGFLTAGALGALFQ